MLDRITTELLDALRDTARLRTSPSCGLRLALAAAWSAYGHALDVLHLKGLGRAVPSVCGGAAQS
ncbi:hypothetical protein [Streptomyces sp. UG1]|uniref:hypothetical protein n=1 Tax=Streptomyces sp. UG1 TaxID=3417652 RepID=UPI003CE8A0B3